MPPLRSGSMASAHAAGWFLFLRRWGGDKNQKNATTEVVAKERVSEFGQTGTGLSADDAAFGYVGEVGAAADCVDENRSGEARLIAVSASVGSYEDDLQVAEWFSARRVSTLGAVATIRQGARGLFFCRHGISFCGGLCSYFTLPWGR